MITVYLWSPTPSEPAGHSALEIRGSQKSDYISWHPKDAPKMPSYDETFGGGVEGHLSNSYEDEIRKKGRQASFTITLSKLNEDAMLEFWSNWKMKLNKFQLLQQNCSHVVAKILTVGWIGISQADAGKLDESTISKQLERTKENLYHYEAPDPRFLEAGTNKVWDTKTSNIIPLSQILRYAGMALGLFMAATGDEKKQGVQYAGLGLFAASALAGGFDSDHAVWDAKLVSGLAYYIKKETNDN